MGKKATNIMAELEMKDIKPAKSKMLIEVKSWPEQFIGGILVGGSNVVIRNELYIGESRNSNEHNDGDIIITSMYSGFHIPTKTGYVKLINYTDILMTKEKEKMDKDKSFAPDTFKPGTNYMLVRYKQKSEKVTDSGILVDMGKEEMSKNDSVIDIVEIVGIGDTEDIVGMAGIDKSLKVGEKVIIDKFVGITMNQSVANPEYIYKIMYYFDVLAKVVKDER